MKRYALFTAILAAGLLAVTTWSHAGEEAAATEGEGAKKSCCGKADDKSCCAAKEGCGEKKSCGDKKCCGKDKAACGDKDASKCSMKKEKKGCCGTKATEEAPASEEKPAEEAPAADKAE